MDRNTVANVKNLYKQTGGHSKRKQVGRLHTESAPTEAVVAKVKADVVSNPETTIRKISRENGLPQTTARWLVKGGLWLKSFVNRRTQLITKP